MLWEEGFGQGKKRKGGSLATPCADTSIHHKLLYYSYYARISFSRTSAIPSHPEDGGSGCGARRGKLRPFSFLRPRRFITLSPSSILYSTSDAATDRGYVADRITLRDAHPRFILVLPRVSQKRVMRPGSVLPRIERYSLKLVRNWRRCTPSSVNEKKMLDC